MGEAALEWWEQDGIPAADRERMRAMEHAEWPPESEGAPNPRASRPPPDRTWAPGQSHRTVLIRDPGGLVVAKGDVDPREVRTPHGPLTVLALAGVLTDPDHRGRGLGARVVRAAFGLVDNGSFTCALFQTTVPGFYERLGARRVANAFVNSRGEHPDVSPFWDPYVMVYPASFAWPDEEVDTLGPGW